MEIFKRVEDFKSELIYLSQSLKQTSRENANPFVILFFCLVISLLVIEIFQIHEQMTDYSMMQQNKSVVTIIKE